MTDSHTSATHRLRLALRANATFSIVSGTTALVAGSWVSRELGIDHVALTRLIGAGLLGFALAVLAISRMDEDRLLRESLHVSLADAGWVVGTVVVLVAGVLTTTGNVVGAIIGLLVGDFAVAQLWFRSRALAPSRQLASAGA